MYSFPLIASIIITQSEVDVNAYPFFSLNFFLPMMNVKGHPRIKCINLHELVSSTTNDEGGPYGYLKKN